MEWIGRQRAKAAAAARQLDAPWLAAAVTLGVAYGLMPLPGAVVVGRGLGLSFGLERSGAKWVVRGCGLSQTAVGMVTAEVVAVMWCGRIGVWRCGLRVIGWMSATGGKSTSRTTGQLPGPNTLQSLRPSFP